MRNAPSSRPLRPPARLLQHRADEPGRPADGTVAERARLEVRRTRGSREEAWGRRGPCPVLQWNRSHFTFCHETKVPSDNKPNREPGCSSTSDTLFSCFLWWAIFYMFLSPHKCWWEGVSRGRRGASPGFNLWRSGCLACVEERARVRARAPEPACGSEWRRRRFVPPGSDKTRLWTSFLFFFPPFWFVCFGNDSLRSRWRTKTLLRLNSSLFLPRILLSCEHPFLFSFLFF